MGILSYFDQGQAELRKITKIANKVDALKESMKALSDDELKYKTIEFKNRINNGETLDDLLVEAYAVVREASLRVTNKYPFFVQVLGGIAIHRGNIAEMKTGEGKTLTSVMPAYLNALSGKGVHIVTVNEYLASRESDGEIGDLFRWLGLTVGLNIRDLSKEQKQAVYNSDIVYSTNNELGFDYLRDNMVIYKEERVQRKLNFAIIDEVDSILIDEARTPLIISGGAKQTNNVYLFADRFVKSLKVEEDYIIDEKTKSVTLTDEGVNKAETAFGVENIYELKYSSLVHRINQALRANYTMKNDVDYVVKDDEIVIVDQFTGRLMKGRAFSDGLHQAIEAKEGVTIKQETRTLATITFQNYFRMYEKLSGMTGTAKTEEEEFRDIYNMFVVPIPTNVPVARIDSPDLIYATLEAKYNAIVNEIVERHNTGQPVLVGTIAIETSELISHLLTRRGIKHEVLNAKNHAREAEIIANAGQKGSVTIATNMAGRGTDIKLGEGVKELGGLCVIGTERHESRRIDNQLRGRSGRQGDAGYTQFYISLKDELMIRFGSDNLQNMLARIGFAEEESIQSKMITKSIESAQKRVEGNNYDVRKRLLQYDEVLRQQREIVYGRRNEILDNESIHETILDAMRGVIEHLIHSYVDQNGNVKEDDLKNIIAYIEQNLLRPEMITLKDLSNKNGEQLISYLIDTVTKFYENKRSELPIEMFNEFEKVVALRVFDQYWMNHIDTMAHLKEGIYLRSYAQENPLRAYTVEGFELFDQMLGQINSDITKYVLKAEIRQNLERQENEKGQTVDSDKDKNVKKQPVRSNKVGRNQPCPCGSGKKYKNCCGDR